MTTVKGCAVEFPLDNGKTGNRIGSVVTSSERHRARRTDRRLHCGAS